MSVSTYASQGIREHQHPPIMSHSQTSGTSLSLIPSSLLFNYPLTSHSPSGRWAHACCAVPSGMFIHGGIASAVLDDCSILESDAFAWRTLSTTGKDKPEKCMGHTASFLAGPQGNQIFLFGGQQGRKLLAKLYSLNLDNCTWKRHTPAVLPSPRAGHAMVTLERGSTPQVAYLFGGQGKKLMNDLFHFSLDGEGNPVFTEITTSAGQPPSPRRGHSMVWDGHDTLIVFAGTHAGGMDHALHAYSISRNEWYVPVCAGAPPSPRTQHSAVMIGSHAMLVFGGCNAQGTFFNDCHVLDTITWTWSRPTTLNAAPAPRYHHSCCMVNNRAIIYGGINSKQTFEGVTVIDSKFDNDISHIAEELTAMASGSLYTPVASVSQMRGLQAHSIRSMDPSAAGGSVAGGYHFRPSSQASCASTPIPSNAVGASSAQGVGSTGMMLDIMKAQLTDLLVKRNMEEQHAQTTRRAEAAEAALVSEKHKVDVLQKEVAALKLMLSEAEAARNASEARCREFETRLSKEATALADALSDAASARVQLASVRNELAGALATQQGLSKELGHLSSKHAKLTSQYDELSRKQGGWVQSSSPSHRGRDSTNGGGAGIGRKSRQQAATYPSEPSASPAQEHTQDSMAAVIPRTVPNVASKLQAFGISGDVGTSSFHAQHYAHLRHHVSHAVASATGAQLATLSAGPASSSGQFGSQAQGDAQGLLAHSNSTAHLASGSADVVTSSFAAQQQQPASSSHQRSNSQDGFYRRLSAPSHADGHVHDGPSSLPFNSTTFPLIQGLPDVNVNMSSALTGHREPQQHTEAHNLSSRAAIGEPSTSPQQLNMPRQQQQQASHRQPSKSGTWRQQDAHDALSFSPPFVVGAAATAAYSNASRSGSGVPNLLLQQVEQGSCSQASLSMIQQLQQVGRAHANTKDGDNISPSTSVSSGPQGVSNDAACMQLLRMLNTSEQQRSAALDELTSIQVRHAELENAARAAQEALSSTQAQLSRVSGSPTVLAETSLQDLKALELELEATAKRVRDEVVKRAMEQAMARQVQKEMNACGVCFEHARAVVFSCGHQACDQCAGKVDTCPFCRQAINAKIRLFDA